MWNGFLRVSLRKQCVSEKLVCCRKVRVQLDRSLEWLDRRAVFVFLHERGTEINKAVRKLWIHFGRLAKLRDLNIDLVRLACFQPGLNVGHRVCPGHLSCEPRKQKNGNHERSGSRTSINSSTRTSSSLCFVP